MRVRWEIYSKMDVEYTVLVVFLTMCMSVHNFSREWGQIDMIPLC